MYPKFETHKQDIVYIYILQAIAHVRVCRGYSASSMHVGGVSRRFQAVLGDSRGLQGLPKTGRLSGGLEGGVKGVFRGI